MPSESLVQPRLVVLTEDQIATIHADSLALLSSVGVRVDSPRARELLARAIGRQIDADRRVRIPSDCVEWAIQKAPSRVDVYSQTGERAFRLGADRTRFGIGVTTLYYQDVETDQVTPFAREHMQAVVRLADALPGYDVISTAGIPQDVPTHLSDLYATLDMLANTTKPLVLLVSDESQFSDVLGLAEHLRGALAPRPFLLPYLNPISPLVMNEGTTDKMLAAIELGLPVIYSSYGMSGASTPIGPTGTLTLLNAELLAGLTLAQLAQAGTAVILGALPAFFDMQTMAGFYDTTSYLLNLACAEMMAAYGLPHCGTSGSGIGWGPDLVASGHQWANHLLSCLGKVGLAPFVGDVLGSKAFSPALAVYADEVIAQARRFASGFAIETADIVLSEISAVGPAGSFLIAESTLAGHKSAYHKSGFFENLRFDTWHEQNQPRASERLREHTLRLMNDLPIPASVHGLWARGERYIEELAKR
jgi:trimethylamine--corrinoid protein Co-methyltransferase